MVGEVTEEVERGRREGSYPAPLLAALEVPFHPDEGLEPPEASAVVQSARPLRSTRPVVGELTVFGKRVVRRLLSWYVAPIARDQTRFNLAILRELRALEERVTRIEGSSAPSAPEQGGPESRARRLRDRRMPGPIVSRPAPPGTSGLPRPIP